jgi:glycine/D-amino acid oxidase-like deaminating enzyme
MECDYLCPLLLTYDNCRFHSCTWPSSGFSKWGLTAGIAGAHLVNDLVNGRENPYYQLVDATRFDPANQAKGERMVLLR